MQAEPCSVTQEHGYYPPGCRLDTRVHSYGRELVWLYLLHEAAEDKSAPLAKLTFSMVRDNLSHYFQSWNLMADGILGLVRTWCPG